MDKQKAIELSKLPDGWQWSYILDEMKDSDGSIIAPCACAIKSTRDCDDAGDTLYFEVFQSGLTIKEAKENVVKYIKTNNMFKSRHIHFMDDE
jgi:hypothetical protein